MGPYYKCVTSASNILPLDKTVLAEMEAANEEELKKLDERLAEAEKIEGESETSDALKARANYLTGIGDKVRFLFLHHFPRLHEMNLGLQAQKLALEKTPGLGSRIDVTLTIVRLGFFFFDADIVTTNMDKAEKCVVSSLQSFWLIYHFTD
jgi:26S proteasome regulatory subunit N7